MEDGLERRALLLQVGEAMKAVSGKPGKGAGALVARAALENRPAGEAALALAQAFSTWPTLLLAEKVDRKALAKAVSTVFAGNPKAWSAYLKAAQKDVAGFGEGVSVAEVSTAAESNKASTAATESDLSKDPATKTLTEAASATTAEPATKSQAAKAGKNEASTKAEKAPESEAKSVDAAQNGAPAENVAATAEGDDGENKSTWPWKPAEGSSLADDDKPVSA